MELVKREWVDCGEQQQQEGDEEEKEERIFRVIQWNTLADGESWLSCNDCKWQARPNPTLAGVSAGSGLRDYDCKWLFGVHVGDRD